MEKPEEPKKEEVKPTSPSEGSFIDLLAQFYGKYFDSSAEAIELLADLQRDYKDGYESIKQFSQDPEAIDKLIDELPEKKQTILLRILLKAGKFGKDMINLFESNEEEKRELAKNLKNFADELKKEIK